MSKYQFVRVLFAVVALIAGIGLWPMSVHADDGALGAVGSSVEPMQNNQVTMAAERVEVVILDDQAWVTCVFTFTNTGPDMPVLMGFPQLKAEEGRGKPELLDFLAEVDGAEVPVTFRLQAEPKSDGAVDSSVPDPSRYEGWHAFEVAFAAGQTRVVRNTYHGALSWSSNGDRGFGYILATGAGWKGPIGKADVVVRWVRDRDVYPGILGAWPDGYTTGNREVSWHFTNLEPTTDNDINVYFRPAYGTGSARYGQALASSGYDYNSGNNWQQASFTDGTINTAWHSVGEAEGTWIEWGNGGLWNTVPTLGVGILPGVANNRAEFKAHGRPKEVLIRLGSLKPGAQWQGPDQSLFQQQAENLDVTEYHLTLKDSATWQFLRLPGPVTVEAFQVVVLSAYPGEKYADVAITEVLYPVLTQDLQDGPLLLPLTGGVGAASTATELFGWLGIGLALLVAGCGLHFVTHRPDLKQDWNPTDKM